jgi:molybdopterin adenylyltransferase
LEREKHHHHESAAASSHKESSAKKLKIALFTVSSSRFRDRNLKDESGDVAKRSLGEAGHECLYSIIDDCKSMIRLSLYQSIVTDDCDGVIYLGGTGLSPRDVTFEAVSPLLDKTLDGFGEIFRRLSYDSIGSPAVMTRAIGGVVDSTVVFCLPGSPDAVKLGMDLIMKELSHAVFIATSSTSPSGVAKEI